MHILYEDNHLFFVVKPAGLLAQGDSTGDPNVVDLLKEHRKRAENKPGEAFVGLVHRLDRPVSGLMVLAKTSKAAQRLTAAWHTPQVVKTYRAVVRSAGAELPSDDWATWRDWLLKNEETNVVRVVPDGSTNPRAQLAELTLRTIASQPPLAEVEVRLGTGRGHQIRVQLAHRGLPIVGDQKYGSQQKYLDQSSRPRIALHAWQLTVPHPTLKRQIQVTAPFPPGWPVRQAESTGETVVWFD